MRFLAQIALCCLLAGGVMAQRRGGGGMAGGFRGGGGSGIARGGGIGGFRGGIGTGGVYRGGGAGVYRGGGGGVYRGGGGVYRGGGGGYYSGGHGFYGGGFRFGYGNRGFFGGRRFGFYGGFWPFYSSYAYYPWWGLGYSPLYSGFYDYGYPYDYYPYNYGYASSAGYNTSPNVTVVYPEQSSPSTVVVERANPVTREYDQYGQEVKPSTTASNAPPIYLIAFKDQVIRAASAYWVDGSTLHYITLEHEQRQVPLSTVDRDFSARLNRERNVPFQLPQ